MALPILLSLIAIAWLCLLYWATGHCILRLSGVHDDAGALAILTKFALGFAVVGNLIMLLCFLRMATPRNIAFTLAALSMTIGISGMSIMRLFKERTQRITFAPFREHPIISGTLLVLCLGYAARGLLPPTGFDVLMYHLSTVKLYLEHEGFWNIYFNGQSDYPMLTQMHFMIGLVFGNDIICRTLSAILGGLTVVTVAVIARKHLGCGSRCTMLAMLIFLTYTNTIANMSLCNVDIPQALWMTLAWLNLELYLKQREKSLLVITAIIAGMAVQTKIFGVFIMPVLLVRLAIAQKSRLLTVKGISEHLVIILVACAMGLPWYLKSYAYTGGIMSSSKSILTLISAPATSTQTDMYTAVWKFANNVIFRIMKAPWSFSLFPGMHRNDTFGPLLIITLPFLLFTGWNKNIRIILTVMAVYWAEILFMDMVYTTGGSSIRYSTFILVCAAPLIPWTVDHLSRYPKTRKTLAVLVAVTIALGAGLFIKRYHRDWTALLTLKTRDEYYRSVLPEYPAIEYINNLNDGKVVMPLFNYSDYLIEVPYITAYRRYASTEEMRADFKEKNIGYIFANDKLDTSANSGGLPELNATECVFGKNGYYLYKVDFCLNMQ